MACYYDHMSNCLYLVRYTVYHYLDKPDISSRNSTHFTSEYCRSGFGVCVDLRYPELARLYAQRGKCTQIPGIVVVEQRIDDTNLSRVNICVPDSLISPFLCEWRLLCIMYNANKYCKL